MFIREHKPMGLARKMFPTGNMVSLAEASEYSLWAAWSAADWAQDSVAEEILGEFRGRIEPAKTEELVLLAVGHSPVGYRDWAGSILRAARRAEIEAMKAALPPVIRLYSRYNERNVVSILQNGAEVKYLCPERRGGETEDRLVEKLGAFTRACPEGRRGVETETSIRVWFGRRRAAKARTLIAAMGLERI